jgi:LmbE family N-acetylglucosaminyl deacetylase
MSNTQSDHATILAFGAHPDDIEYGCGAVIARETRLGRRAHLVVCSSGESSTNGTPEERRAEAAEAARHLGATLEFVDLGGDSHFECQVRHSIALASIIRRVKPEIALAPSLVENQHPDHYKLGRMVREAARLARYCGLQELRHQAPHAVRQLLYYAVTPQAEPRDLPCILMNVSSPEVIEAWTRAMQSHASQARTRNYTEMQLLRARFLGSCCGVDHAVALFPNDPMIFDSLGDLGNASRHF